MACVNCGSELSAGFAFCPRCGHRQPSPCPACGFLCEADFAFCPGCGAARNASDLPTSAQLEFTKTPPPTATPDTIQGDAEVTLPTATTDAIRDAAELTRTPPADGEPPPIRRQVSRPRKSGSEPATTISALLIAVALSLGIAIWGWMVRMDKMTTGDPLMVYVTDRWLGTVQLCNQRDCKQIYPQK
jgi:Double zinc ribbon